MHGCCLYKNAASRSGLLCIDYQWQIEKSNSLHINYGSHRKVNLMEIRIDRNFSWKPYIAATVAILTIFSPSLADGFCFSEAGRLFSISPKLLEAIARHESQLNPSAVNQNTDGSYDFGLMQINSLWRTIVGEKIWNSLSEPCQNVKVGAWILARCIKRHGYNWTAVGCYNARSEQKRRKYERRIYQMLRSMIESTGDQQSTEKEPVKVSGPK